MIWKHECNRPKVYNYGFDLLPDEVKDRLVASGLKDADLKSCSYCGDIWVETRNPEYSPHIIQTVVGIKDVGTAKMIWKV